MILTFRPIKIWPDGWDPVEPWRQGHPFSAGWTPTVNLLDDELNALGATDPVLQVAASERQCRLNGMIRADAVVSFPGVILSFQTPKHGTLTYQCDRFGPKAWNASRFLPGWQANVRAIALGLEALRKVERYGIADRGQQYAGYAELPSGIPLGRGMTVEEAAAFIALHSEAPDDPTLARDLMTNPVALQNVWRRAAKRLHPDHGGDPDLFRKLVQAKDLLEAQ